MSGTAPAAPYTFPPSSTTSSATHSPLQLQQADFTRFMGGAGGSQQQQQQAQMFQHHQQQQQQQHQQQQRAMWAQQPSPTASSPAPFATSQQQQQSLAQSYGYPQYTSYSSGSPTLANAAREPSMGSTTTVFQHHLGNSAGPSMTLRAPADAANDGSPYATSPAHGAQAPQHVYQEQPALGSRSAASSVYARGSPTHPQTQHGANGSGAAESVTDARDTLAGNGLANSTGSAAAQISKSAAGAQSGGPLSQQHQIHHAHPQHTTSSGSAVKASSTTAEFTKRKNWSQHIIDEIQDLMHVLSPSGNIMFTTPSIQELTGWQPDQVVGRPLREFVHPDDWPAFEKDFDKAIREATDLVVYYRFRTVQDRYIIFEVTGHPYYVDQDGNPAPATLGIDTSSGAPSPNGPNHAAAAAAAVAAASGGKRGSSDGSQTERRCNCFFAIGRQYPSKNTAMLDSFLELKIENERLRQELQAMYKEIEGSGMDLNAAAGENGQSDSLDPASARGTSPGVPGSPTSNGGGTGLIDPNTGIVRPQGLIPSSSNTYGALGIGISGPKGAEDKKKKNKTQEGDFVCRDCGTVDSPEWRKGPDGPKSLCNACGLRWAKKAKTLKQNGVKVPG